MSALPDGAAQSGQVSRRALLGSGAAGAAAVGLGQKNSRLLCRYSTAHPMCWQRMLYATMLFLGPTPVGTAWPRSSRTLGCALSG
jgi:hypothetical protein